MQVNGKKLHRLSESISLQGLMRSYQNEHKRCILAFFLLTRDSISYTQKVKLH